MTGLTTDHLASFLYGTSSILSLPFETKFTPTAGVNFCAQNWPIVMSIVVGYLFVIFSGRKIMESRKPFDLSMWLAAWNGFLCVFSFV
jgi:uncharacterized membrane protein (UPF0136 family)